MKKRIFVCAVMSLLAMTVTAHSDSLSIRKMFVEMPDSLLPYLSKNNKLDFIDFMDSKMKAEVTNELGGKSVMTALTNDSLSISLNEASRLDLVLLETEEPVDSSCHVVCLIKTVSTLSECLETVVNCFSVRWKKQNQFTSLTAKNKERLLLYAKPSNILNNTVKRLNKY